MRSAFKKVIFSCLAVGLAGTGLAAQAAVTWTFDSASCDSTVGGSCSNSSLSDSRTYTGDDGTTTVTVTGWANTTGGNTRLERGEITQYGGGLGVRNADAGGGDSGEDNSPEHAVDNDDRFDLVMFDFGDELVDLSEVAVGWFSNDADISVLAYTGVLDPTDSSSADFIGGREAWWNSGVDKGEDLTSHGWSLIGNHDVDNSSSNRKQAINGGSVQSSVWIVSAYNPVFGSNCTPSNSYCQSDYADYLKISSVTGVVDNPPPPAGAPEPATALLLATALPFLRRRMRAMSR